MSRVCLARGKALLRNRSLELDLTLGGGLLQSQQPLVFGQQVVALPHTSDTP